MLALYSSHRAGNNQTVRWYVPANGALDAVSVPVNGSVTFSWTSSHDVWEIPSASCPQTFSNGSGITQVAPQSNGGSRTVQFPDAGTRHFACSVSDHCTEGEQLVETGTSAYLVCSAFAACPKKLFSNSCPTDHLLAPHT